MCVVETQKPTYLQQWPLHNKHLTDPHTVTTTDLNTNMRHIHTPIVSRHLATRGNITILRTPAPHINSSEEILHRLICRTSPQLKYINYNFSNHTYTNSTPNHFHHHYATFCNTHIHNTHHLFNSTHIRTTLLPLDL